MLIEKAQSNLPSGPDVRAWRQGDGDLPACDRVRIDRHARSGRTRPGGLDQANRISLRIHFPDITCFITCLAHSTPIRRRTFAA